jgi:hypothetical protein
MTYQAGYNLTASDGATSTAGLGDEAIIEGAVWRYVKASGAISAYDFVTITDAGLAASGTTTTAGSGPVGCGVAQFAFASGDYGWVAVGPFFLREDGLTAFKVNALTLCALDVKLYTTATAGAIDDSATTLVSGLLLTTTNATGGTVAEPCIAVRRLACNV